MRSGTDSLPRAFGALILTASFLFAQTTAGDANSSETIHPVSIGQREVRDHLLGDAPFLRMSLPTTREAVLLSMLGITVRLTIDRSGAVTSAVADKNLSADIRLRAEATVRKLRYRPFERGGHPVAATFEESVIVLPPELVPKTRVPFPQVQDWNSVRITLRRTGCFGKCPSYQVEIHGDGTVLYEGGDFVADKGSRRGSMPKATVIELVNAFHDADYYSLQDEYVWSATDLPTYETSIEIDGRFKKVMDYAGEKIGMPLTVSKLEADIDRLAETDRWTKGERENY
jgi:hypothetical protein